VWSARRGWLPLLAPVAALVVVWHAAVVLSGSTIFPTPWQVAVGLADLARRGLLLKHVVASLFGSPSATSWPRPSRSRSAC